METPEHSAQSAEQLQDMIANAVKTAMQETAAQAQQTHDPSAEQDDIATQPTQPASGTPRDPMADLVAPYVQQANVAAAAANDKADFYTDYTVVKDGEEDEEERTISRQMRSEIEKLFTNLLKQGRPQTRESIYHYLLGKAVATDKKKYLERSSKKKQQEVTEAKAGFDIGNANASQSMSIDQMWNMPLEQMSQTLADTTF